MSGNDVVVGAYDVFRTSGYYASGTVSGRENILNAFGSVGLHPNGVLVEPTLEVRHWQQSIPEFTSGSTVTPGRGQSSYLGTVGVRTRLEVAGVSVFPGAGFTLGSVATFDAAGLPAKAGLTGFRAQLAMRATPFGQ